MRVHAQRALAAWAARAGDDQVARTVGSAPVLALVFGEMARRYDAQVVAGFGGALQFDLRSNGRPTRHWAVLIAGDRAVARRGTARDATARIETGVADFVRLALGEVEIGDALLDGRLDVEGDFVLASRLGAMFGRPGG